MTIIVNQSRLRCKKVAQKSQLLSEFHFVFDSGKDTDITLRHKLENWEWREAHEHLVGCALVKCLFRLLRHWNAFPSQVGQGQWLFQWRFKVRQIGVTFRESNTKRISVRGMQPLSLVEKPSFKQLVQFLDPLISIPSRFTFTNSVLPYHYNLAIERNQLIT